MQFLKWLPNTGELCVHLYSVVCFLQGLSMTLFLLFIFRKALPALPISIAFGLAFYFVTSLVVVDFVNKCQVNQIYIQQHQTEKSSVGNSVYRYMHLLRLVFIVARTVIIRQIRWSSLIEAQKDGLQSQAFAEFKYCRLTYLMIYTI